MNPTSEFCSHPHEVRITWGSEQRQTAECCTDCAKEVFERAKPQISAGLLPFIMEPLEK